MHEQVRPGRVFLDDQLRPYPDDQQWTYLASVQRIDRRTVETIAGEAKKAACALLAHEIGAFVAPPGVGKTVVGTYLAAERRCSTLILVHRQPLLDQWIAQLSLFLGVDVKEIGQIGAGKRSANSRLDVAMLQSLVRSGKVA